MRDSTDVQGSSWLAVPVSDGSGDQPAVLLSLSVHEVRYRFFLILSLLVLTEVPLRNGLTKSAGLSYGFAWSACGVWL